jgi:hypothetical protein
MEGPVSWQMFQFGLKKEKKPSLLKAVSAKQRLKCAALQWQW